MNAYAVVESGGKQYRVQAGDTLNVELLDAEPGTRLNSDESAPFRTARSSSWGGPT